MEAKGDFVKMNNMNNEKQTQSYIRTCLDIVFHAHHCLPKVDD